MDKIFKNDNIMGIVALLTLALTAWVVYQNYKTTKALTEETPDQPVG